MHLKSHISAQRYEGLGSIQYFPDHLTVVRTVRTVIETEITLPVVYVRHSLSNWTLHTQRGSLCTVVVREQNVRFRVRVLRTEIGAQAIDLRGPEASGSVRYGREL